MKKIFLTLGGSFVSIGFMIWMLFFSNWSLDLKFLVSLPTLALGVFSCAGLYIYTKDLFTGIAYEETRRQAKAYEDAIPEEAESRESDTKE